MPKSKGTPLSSVDLDKLKNAERSNIAGNGKTTLIHILDNAQQLLLPFMLQGAEYQYFRGGEASAPFAEIIRTRAHNAINPIIEYALGDDAEKKSALKKCPTKEELHAAFTAVYRVLDDTNPAMSGGKDPSITFSREGIQDAMAILGLPAISDDYPVLQRTEGKGIGSKTGGRRS